VAESIIFNLADFDENILRPSLASFAAQGSDRARAYDFASAVAGYFWLVLGIEVKYFPEEHAQSLFSQRFHEFFARFEDLFKAYGHVFDPEFEPVLRTAVSYRSLSRRAEQLRMPPHPICTGALRASLLAECRFLREREGNALVSALDFEPNLLEDIMRRGTVADVRGVTLNQDAVARGFQAVVDYMETLIGLSAVLEQEEEQVGRDLDVRLHQLTRWRVNRRLGAGQRFVDVALFVSRHCGGGALSRDEVADHANLFLQRWGVTHSAPLTLRARGATAGA
jgi:hypothetical protein